MLLAACQNPGALPSALPSAVPLPAATAQPSEFLIPDGAATAVPTMRVTAPSEQALISPLTSPPQPPLVALSQSGPPARQWGYKVVASYPHDIAAFTEGLEWHDGTLYESTGLNKHSNVRVVALETGAVARQHDIEARYFGEGITLFGGALYQLTWREHTGFVYDGATFAPLRTWTYPTEGWGLTHDDSHLIMSDGSATLRFLDPQTLAVVRAVSVTDGGVPVASLNELEYVKGEVLANIWQSDRIARIDPLTGWVTGWIDLSGLLSDAERAGRPVDVLNGIAYDAVAGRLFVTGKFWPKVYEIALVPRG